MRSKITKRKLTRLDLFEGNGAPRSKSSRLSHKQAELVLRALERIKPINAEENRQIDAIVKNIRRDIFPKGFDHYHARTRDHS